MLTGLGNPTTKVISKEESWSLNHGFFAGAIMPTGTLVKIDVATGQLVPVAALTDKPFGILSVGAKKIGDECTVQTKYVAIVRGQADGNVTIGDDLASSGMLSTGEKLMKYKKAVATNYICAEALSTATSGNNVWVGVLRVPSLMA